MRGEQRLLIAVDIDGTLLNSKKAISHPTKRFLRRLTRRGHIIVLASGRPSRALNKYYRELGLHSPMVCYNGAYVFHPTDLSFPKVEFQFPKDVIKNLFSDLRPYIRNVMCENDTDIWIDEKDLYLAKFFWYEGMKMHYGDICETLDVNPMTMILQTDKDHIDEGAIRAIVAKYPGIDVRFWFGLSYFEIFFKSTSKGSGLSHIAEYYGIKKENIIAFGDAENDIDMFAAAGIGVAMKNGGPDIVRHAHRESLKDNDNDGIYHTLKAIIKERKRATK